MFILKLYDRKGTELHEGDLVKISDGNRFKFFSEVKYLEKENAIAPFHTFSFHSFEKVDAIPSHAKESTEERYKIWFTHNPENDEDSETYEHYLRDWRMCEMKIDKKVYGIEKIIK